MSDDKQDRKPGPDTRAWQAERAREERAALERREAREAVDKANSRAIEQAEERAEAAERIQARQWYVIAALVLALFALLGYEINTRWVSVKDGAIDVAPEGEAGSLDIEGRIDL